MIKNTCSSEQQFPFMQRSLYGRMFQKSIGDLKRWQTMYVIQGRFRSTGRGGGSSLSSPSSRWSSAPSGTPSVPSPSLQRRWRGRGFRLDWNPGVRLDRLNNCLVHLVGLPRLCNLVSSICSCSLSKLKIFCGNISKKTKIYPPTLNLPKVAASFCMLAGACLRCLPLLIPSMGSSFTALCHAGRYLSFTVPDDAILLDKQSSKYRSSSSWPGSFINMIAGPIAMSAPIQISAAWFPPQVHFCNIWPCISIYLKERTRATSIGQMFNALGVREAS